MIKRAVLLAACFAILLGPLALAQTPPATPLPPGVQAPATPAPPAAAPPVPAPAPRPFGQPVTIRIELTITDQVGTAAPVKKLMTLLAADGERASVRSYNRTPGQNSAQFNVDAKPMIMQDRIRMDLSLNYDPPEIPRTGEKQLDSSGKPMDLAWSTQLQESMGIIVENGKPMIVSQSADPRTDRKVTVEVKATILK